MPRLFIFILTAFACINYSKVNAQISLGRAEKSVKNAEQIFDEAEYLSFFNLNFVPITYDGGQSNTSINFGVEPSFSYQNLFFLHGSITKAYTDELRSDNYANNRSLSIYKEQSTLQWAVVASFPFFTKLNDSEQIFLLDKKGNTNYITRMEVKRFLSVGPRVGMGYRAGHIDDFNSLFKGVQLSQTDSLFPFEAANRSILDYQYFKLGLSANISVNAAFNFEDYGTRANTKYSSFYFDVLYAYNYTLDNIIMDLNQVELSFGGGRSNYVEYELQENTPFNRIGAHAGYSHTRFNDNTSLTYGVEAGLRPGVGNDFYAKIMVAFGLKKISHSTD